MSENNVNGITGADVATTTGIVGATIAIGQYIVNDYVITIAETEGDYGYTMTITRGTETQTVTLYGLTEEQYDAMLGYLQQAQEAAQSAQTADRDAQAALSRALNAALAAADSESNAAEHASESLEQAGFALQSANDARAASIAAQSAQQQAQAAQTAAETAKASAQTAQAAAEAARTAAETAETSAGTSASQASQSATNAAQSATDAQRVLDSIPADYTQMEADVADLKSQTDAMRAATASDVGKALKAKTVTDGKVVEWEFGEAGGEYYETTTLNLLDGINWVTNQSDPIPVEYGKDYTANFTAYGNRVYALDASQNSLGNLASYNGVTYTDSFSVYDTRRVYHVANADVAYIQFRQMNKPSKTPLYILDGDVALPVHFIDEQITPTIPGINDLHSAMFTATPLDRTELSSDLQTSMRKLGWKNQPLTIEDIYGYDATTCPYKIADGNLYVGTAAAFQGGAQSLLLDPAINVLSYKFAQTIITNNNYKYSTSIVLQTNIGHRGVLLVFKTYGNQVIGIDYVYWWNLDGTITAMTSAYAFVNDYPMTSLEVIRNADSYDFNFVDTQGTSIKRHLTFAQLSVTDADYMGFWTPQKSNAIDDGLLAYDIKTSAAASVVTASSKSSMYGSTYDAWGDSYTAGSGTYCHLIGEDNGCTVNNYGVSGDKVSSVLTRINASSADSGAYVSVLAGVNDYLHDTAMADFRTAVQGVITALIDKSVSAKFAWITPPQIGITGANGQGLELEDYVDAIIEICAANSVPVLDMYHSGGWYGTVAAFRSTYMSTDNLHPNSVGQAFLAHKIGEFMERL